jgi:hypothetical protein
MATGDVYRARAAVFDARARTADPAQKAEFERLARGYRKLAEQADKNELTDVVYETPIQSQPQQSQQGKLMPGKE